MKRLIPSYLKARDIPQPPLLVLKSALVLTVYTASKYSIGPWVRVPERFE